MFLMASFNTQPPEGGWECSTQHHPPLSSFNTQPPEGGWLQKTDNTAGFRTVSTHSRPKAAGVNLTCCKKVKTCFNTQPPEGGWGTLRMGTFSVNPFQHTAARRRLVWLYRRYGSNKMFQHTAARRRLVFRLTKVCPLMLFQHTAARRRLGIQSRFNAITAIVSTHSRPKAAG